LILQIDSSFSRFSLDRFSWARMIVCSRNFGLTIDGVKTAALVPFADMLNHYRPRETSWTFDHSLGAFTITSLGTIASGAQVYDSYGRMCNHRFLLNYGFAVEDNTEEDGRNPNEVMVDLQLNQTDGQLFYDKRAYLHESGIYTMDARLSRSHSDPNTREGFSFARLIVSTEEEFTSMKMKSPAHTSPPLSFDNESAALPPRTHDPAARTVRDDD
jgi:protein-histidine N-methyltransferase